MKDRIAVLITGASGSIYGYRALEMLSVNYDVHSVISSSARVVMRHELGVELKDLRERFPKVTFHNEKDLTSPLASGSYLTGTKAVLVMPCSTSTLGSVACGVNITLIHRVCEVALKERVKLIMLVREMPYSRIHLENMLRLTDAGAIIVPASPAFYHRPRSVEDMIDFVVGKVFDLIPVSHELYNRWRGGEK